MKGERTSSIKTLTVAALCTLLGALPRAGGQCVALEFDTFQPVDFTNTFGATCAMRGNIAIFGAHFDDDAALDAGAAYIFRFDPGQSEWVQEQKLFASDAQPEQHVGESVAIEGTLAVVGAPSNWPFFGAVYLFRYDGTSWNEEIKLTPSDSTSGDNFGAAVAVSGNAVIVGKGVLGGSAYIFRHNGFQWIEEAKLVEPNGNQFALFGLSVSISGNWALAGASHDVGGVTKEPGVAHLYHFNGNSWTPHSVLTPSDSAPADGFGWAVSMAGDRAVIGAFFAMGADTQPGSAYVFQRQPDGVWLQDGKLVPAAAGQLDFVGDAVAISGDHVLLGASGHDGMVPGGGAAFLFHKTIAGTWVEEGMLWSNDVGTNDSFGRCVTMDGALALVTSAAGGWKTFAYRGLADCDGNDGVDLCDIATGVAADCNQNGVPDSCDVASGGADVNGNGIPDECEDCNGNGAPDDLDILNGTSADCNGDGVPDECPTAYTIEDGQADVGIGSASGPVDRIWLNHLVVRPGEELIAAIGIVWWGLSAGVPTALMIYQDPTNDGDPADAVLMRFIEVQSVATGPQEFFIVPIDPVGVGSAGDSYFVGAYLTQGANEFPMAFDTDPPFPADSWIISEVAGQADIFNLANNLSPPDLIGDVCCDGNWLLRAYASPACIPAGDLNLDGTIDRNDLMVLLAGWGLCPAPPEGCPADLDADGRVAVPDLLTLLANWG